MAAGRRTRAAWSDTTTIVLRGRSARCFRGPRAPVQLPPPACRGSSRLPRRQASRGLRGGLRRPLLPPAPAALARPGLGKQHRLARFGVGALEGAPPGFEFGGDFSAGRTQCEKIISHAKARRLEQAIRALSRTLLEARLHCPNRPHGGGEVARDDVLDTQ